MRAAVAAALLLMGTLDARAHVCFDAQCAQDHGCFGPGCFVSDAPASGPACPAELQEIGGCPVSGPIEVAVEPHPAPEPPEKPSPILAIGLGVTALLGAGTAAATKRRPLRIACSIGAAWAGALALMMGALSVA